MGTGQGRKLRWHAAGQEGCVPTPAEIPFTPTSAGNSANGPDVAQLRSFSVGQRVTCHMGLLAPDYPRERVYSAGAPPFNPIATVQRQKIVENRARQ